jgi:hypothetical protein
MLIQRIQLTTHGQMSLMETNNIPMIYFEFNLVHVLNDQEVYNPPNWEFNINLTSYPTA